MTDKFCLREWQRCFESSQLFLNSFITSSHLFSTLLNESEDILYQATSNLDAAVPKAQSSSAPANQHSTAWTARCKSQRETSVPLRPLPKGFRAKAVIPPTALQPSLLFPAPWHPFAWKKTKFQIWFLLTSSKPFHKLFSTSSDLLSPVRNLFSTPSQPFLTYSQPPLLNLLFSTFSLTFSHFFSTSSQSRLNFFYSSLLCSALLCSLCSSLIFSSPLLSFPLLSSLLFSDPLFSSLIGSTLLYSSLLYSTLLYSVHVHFFATSLLLSTVLYSILLYFMLSWPYFIRNSVFLYEPSFDHTQVHVGMLCCFQSIGWQFFLFFTGTPLNWVATTCSWRPSP